jgi:hypothetical protein
LKTPLWLEARFMFARPDAVLVTHAGAGAWYFPGLADLYTDRGHAIVVHSETGAEQRQVLNGRPWYVRRGDTIAPCVPGHCRE